MNAPEKHEERVITDELLGIARKHIGATLKTHPPFNEYVTTDAIRHFAHGGGDDNPLYCDVDYGSSTRLGGVIAPPMFFRSTGVPENREKLVCGPHRPGDRSSRVPKPARRVGGCLRSAQHSRREAEKVGRAEKVRLV